MCGFVGFIAQESVGNKKQFFVTVIDRMMQAIAHRGFDGDGFFCSPDDRVFFGHKRLAIVTKTSAGSQPLTTPDGRYTIIFNGEIYNYRQLIPELACAGYVVDSDTDTQVLLFGFACWGVDFVKKLRGMFAFVIWDSVEQAAYLVRDEFGIKPLYFAQIEHEGVSGVLFASELKALLASGLVPRKINHNVLAGYLRYGFVRAPETMIRGVQSLEPATILVLKKERQTRLVFWNITSIQVRDEWCDFEDCVGAVREKLLNVLELYAAAAVDLGVFLSAGIDSTFLLSALVLIFGKKVSSFSLGFTSPFTGLTDESQVAARTAQRLGSDHYQIQVDGIAARSAFSSFIHAVDQPSSDGFNTFLISQLAGKHTPVVFSGIGGDELFLGYRYFNDVLKKISFAQFPGAQATLNVAAYVADQSSLLKGVLHLLGLGFLLHGELGDVELYHVCRSVPNYKKLAQVLSFDVRAKSVMNFLAEDLLLERIFAQEPDVLNAFSKAELTWYVPGVLLRDTDAVSMASTIEVRVPFLDKELVELVLSMPSRYKKWSKQPFNKPLLVEAFKELFPEEVLSGSKKGFEMPLGFWLKDAFKDRVQVLKDAPWVDKIVVERLCRRVHADPREYKDLWLLVVLANWAEHNNVTF